MAKPRVFISSTFYDLKQIRSDLDKFIRVIGFEPVRNEKGTIPYPKDIALEENCYKEITTIDFMVCIIGGRYGSKSLREGYSISQMEIKTAIDLDKQLFIFIEKTVLAEYGTYLKNKRNKGVKYRHVDNDEVYKFIEKLAKLPRNNSMHPFESSEDIIAFLTEQWAGMFHRFLVDQNRLPLAHIAASRKPRPEEPVSTLTIRNGSAKPIVLEIAPSERLDTVLDRIYRLIKPRVAPYSYLVDWVLQDSETKTRLIIKEVQHVLLASAVFWEDREWRIVYLDKPYSPLTSVRTR